MKDLINAGLNTLLVSIPEELVCVLITLILLKRFDLLDIKMWKYNIKYIMIPVIPTAIISNIGRYIAKIPLPISFLISFSIMVCLTVYIVKKNNFLHDKMIILKTVLCVFLGMVFITVIEFIYIPITLSFINKTIEDINHDVFINFLISIPGRIMQFILIFYIIYRKNSITIYNFFEQLFSDKTITIITCSFTGLIILIWSMLVYLLGKNNEYSLLKRIIFSVLSLVIPTLMIGLLLFFLSYIFDKFRKMQKSHQNMLDNSIDDDF